MLQCKPNKEIKNQSTQPTAPSNDKGEPTKTTMGNTNSIAISVSIMIPRRLIPAAGLLVVSRDHITSLLGNGGIKILVEDVKRLLNREESIEQIVLLPLVLIWLIEMLGIDSYNLGIDSYISKI